MFDLSKCKKGKCEKCGRLGLLWDRPIIPSFEERISGKWDPFKWADSPKTQKQCAGCIAGDNDDKSDQQD